MKKKNKVLQALLILMLIILSLMIVYPFLLLVGISFSNEHDIVKYGYNLVPRNFDVSAYKYIFESPDAIINAYKVTATYSILGMFLSVLCMAMIAYPLSKRKFKHKQSVSFILFFTMLFSGGLVPTYILMTQYLHLNDTIWVYILPGLVSPWYVFMIRTFFQGLPEEISESALIDGASEYTIFLKIILPLSKPVLATIALFVFLAKWNDWYTAMLYINKESLISLQYMLQRILKNIELIRTSEFAASVININEIPSETMRMAMAVVVAGPALLVFPFFQKYFVKGLTVGAVKG